MSFSTRAVSSRGVPTGMSSTTWNSLLLSKGSIFSTTSFTTARETERKMAASTPRKSFLRAAAPLRSSRKGGSTLWKSRSSLPATLPSSAPWPPPWASSLAASQGVTMKATAREMAMPREELMGMGLM